MASKPANVEISLSQHTWPGRGHVAVFIRCLHHLDLDLLEDWPGVTEQLFHAKTAQQSTQQRVKAVEWSLYRLFEIHDAVETKDKLRPFFPPTTQLQSLNLRAALYRCLNELKKDGVLGKDVVLRKTMLDDCKGERLEEVLAIFSMAVLQKVRKLPATAKKTLLSESQLVPIILAYRASIQTNLQTRREETARARQTLNRLTGWEAKLLERLERAEGTQAELDIEKQRQLLGLVNSNWIGNHTWSKALLCGVPGQKIIEEHSIADRQFMADEPQQLIDELNDRIKRHQNRLSEWQIIAKDFAKRQNHNRIEANTVKEPMVEEADVLTRFSRHKALSLSSWDLGTIKQLPTLEPYRKMLNTMRDEIGALSAPTRYEGYNKQGSPQASSKVMTESSTSPNVPVTQHPESLHAIPEYSPSPQPLPVPELFLKPELVVDEHTLDDSPRPDSPQSVISNKTESPWTSSQTDVVAHTEERSTTPVENSSPSLSTADLPPVSPSKMWMSLAERTRASMSLTGRQSILTDPDSSTVQETEPDDNDATTGLHLSSDEDRRSTLLERTRKSMSMFTTSSAPRPRKSKRAKPVSLPEEEHETLPDSGIATPRDQLFSDDADYASVFKSRPKLAASPSFGPRRSISPLLHENGFDTLDNGLFPNKANRGGLDSV